MLAHIIYRVRKSSRRRRSCVDVRGGLRTSDEVHVAQQMGLTKMAGTSLDKTFSIPTGGAVEHYLHAYSHHIDIIMYIPHFSLLSCR